MTDTKAEKKDVAPTAVPAVMMRVLIFTRTALLLPAVGCNFAFNAIVTITFKIAGVEDDNTDDRDEQDDDEAADDEDDDIAECHALIDRICGTSRLPHYQTRASGKNKTQA